MTEITNKGGALQGLRVVECATVVAGPLCGRLFGDFGAEVIHVEHPKKGDPLRDFGFTVDGINPWWKYYDRNKKLVTLDISKPRGREILFDMLKDADIFIENFRPGRLEAWNIHYEDLAKINPRLIMIRLTGYGQTGPYASQPGFGDLPLIDQEILAEVRAVLDRQSHDVYARFRIIGVDVNDRNLEPLGEIAGVARGSRIDGIGREPDLIVDDDVERSARSKRREAREVERLGNNALAGKCRVAVDTDGQHRGLVALTISGDHLPRSGNSLEHRIHDFEMARIRNQHDLDLATARDRSLSLRAEVVLYVAGLAHSVGRGVLSLELLEDRRVRLAERVRKNVDASAVRHCQIDFTGAVGGC